MDSVTFSVIIPTYNRAKFIDKAIESLLNQTYKNFEIIVVDDGSTDNTEEVVNLFKDSKIKYIKKENQERGAARNYGAKLAVGDYVNFFDSDDIAYDNHLQVAFDTIKANDFPKVFALNYDVLVSENKLKSQVKFKDINKQLISKNLLSCNGVFIKKEVLQKNSFSEIRDLSASEDYLLWFLLASQFKIVGNNTITSTIVDHNSRSVVTMQIDKLILRKEIFLREIAANEHISQYYSKYSNRIKSQVFSYIALHVSLTKINRIISMKYLCKALYQYPFFVFSKRFFAIIKHLMY